MLTTTLIIIALAVIFFVVFKGGKLQSRNETAEIARKAVEAKMGIKPDTEKDAD